MSLEKMFGYLRVRKQDERSAVIPALCSHSSLSGNHVGHWVISSLALTSYIPEKVSLTKDTAFLYAAKGFELKAL